MLRRCRVSARSIAELEKIKIPVGPGTAQFQVTEEPIYRFAGTEAAPSGFDFATDLLAAANGDQAAFDRVQKFTAENLTSGSPTSPPTGDTSSALNQPQYRPDMFLGQAPTPQSPLYDFFHKGVPDERHPVLLVQARPDQHRRRGHRPHRGRRPRVPRPRHHRPVPPSPRPGLRQGAHHPRGRRPGRQPAGLRAHLQPSSTGPSRSRWRPRPGSSSPPLPAPSPAELRPSPPAPPGSPPAGLSRPVSSTCSSSPTAPGSKAFGHSTSTRRSRRRHPEVLRRQSGRKLYPIINPQNRDGIQASKYSFIDLAGYRMQPCREPRRHQRPASNSYVADPNAVHVWNSGLTKLDKLQEKVEGWDIGCLRLLRRDRLRRHRPPQDHLRPDRLRRLT
jgi:hypothetical protein